MNPLNDQELLELLNCLFGSNEVKIEELESGDYNLGDIKNVCAFLSLSVRNKVDSLSVYASVPNLGKWCRLAKFLISHEVEELQEGERLSLIDAMGTIINTIFVGSIGEDDSMEEDIEPYTNLFLRFRRDEFLGIYSSLLPIEHSKHRVIELLKGGKGVYRTFLSLCNDYGVVDLYASGMQKGYFPPITTWEEFKELAVALKRINRLKKGVINSLGCLPFTEELLGPQQATFLLELGYEDILEHVVAQGFSGIPVSYGPMVEGIKSRIALDERLNSTGKVVSEWDALSDDERTYLLESRLARGDEFIQLGELPYYCTPLGLALFKAGKISGEVFTYYW